MKRIKHRYSISAFLLVLGLSLSLPVSAVNLDALKVSYIYNLIKYVTWPPGTFENEQQSYKVCMAWDGYFDHARHLLEEQKIGDRGFVVEEVRLLSNLDGCHVLFISSNETERIKRLTASIPNRPLLTISDDEKFAEQGGIISFVIVDSKLKFEINWTQAKAVNLVINSRVLMLAAKVW